MSKSKSSPRVFSRAFKLGIIRRMLAGEKRERLGARTEADAHLGRRDRQGDRGSARS